MTTPDESFRDMEQVRHSIETKELPSDRFQSETQTSSVQIVTPLYKAEKQAKTDLQMGGNHQASYQLSHQNGDYKAERSQEQFRMQIIDPKVNSNAHIPSQTGSLPNYGRRYVDDFPSQHGKRSLLKLDPLEQRRIRSVESRPITTSTYLTESVDRHREMEASKLRQYLKASEDDANKPWNKPAWPGPKNNEDTGESLRELEQIRKKIDSLQKAAQEPKKNEDLDELARKNRELAERSKNRRTDIKLVGTDIIKTDPEPLPAHFKEQIREMLESRISTDTSSVMHDRSGYVTDASSATWQFNNSFSPRSIVSLNGAKAEDASGLLKVRTSTAPPEDDKPRSIMKRSQLESREQMTYAEPERRVMRESHHEVVRAKPKVTETVQRVEEQKRTEEVERRIIRRERRQKSSRHRYGHGQQEYIDWHGGEAHENQRVLTENQQMSAGASANTRVEQKSDHEHSLRRVSQGVQTQQPASGLQQQRKVILQRYEGRRYTADELNQAVKRAYQAVDKAHSDLRTHSIFLSASLPLTLSLTASVNGEATRCNAAATTATSPPTKVTNAPLPPNATVTTILVTTADSTTTAAASLTLATALSRTACGAGNSSMCRTATFARTTAAAVKCTRATPPAMSSTTEAAKPRGVVAPPVPLPSSNSRRLCLDRPAANLPCRPRTEAGPSPTTVRCPSPAATLTGTRAADLSAAT